MIRPRLLLPLLLLVACGGTRDDEPSGPLAGTTTVKFTPVDVIAVEGTSQDDSGNEIHVVRIIASDLGGLCSRIGKDSTIELGKNENVLSVKIQAPAFEAKKVSLDGEQSGAGVWFGPTCQDGPKAGTGTIDISKVGDTISGVIDADVSGARFAGHFDAKRCAVQVTGLANCP